jgi:UPF0176 protein
LRKADVAQLDGGIVSYGKDPEVKGKLFDGKCYVFDERISIPINQIEDIAVGKCIHCRKSADCYINCKYAICNRQHIVCEKCKREYEHYCSQGCEEKDGEGE